jgi:hypothetical protein
MAAVAGFFDLPGLGLVAWMWAAATVGCLLLAADTERKRARRRGDD